MSRLIREIRNENEPILAGAAVVYGYAADDGQKPWAESAPSPSRERSRYRTEVLQRHDNSHAIERFDDPFLMLGSNTRDLNNITAGAIP